MTDRHDEIRDLERRLPPALEGATPTPAPGLADRLLATATTTPQRRGWLPMSLAPAAPVAAVVVLAVVVAIGYARFQRGVGDPTVTPPESPVLESSSPAVPSSTPAPEPSEVPSPSASSGETVPCTDPVDGFRVEYPRSWFANDRVEQEFGDAIPPCRYFGEAPLEIIANAGVPTTVAITIERHEQALPTDPSTSVVEQSETTVDGQPAWVIEVEWTVDAAPFFAAGDRRYEYRIQLPDGGVLIASTDTTADGDYATHRDVLDAMMETLVLD